MYQIYFDEETRSFSAGKMDAVKAHLGKHKSKYLAGAATAGSAAIGAAVARAKAKKAAKAKGLKPGTPEYKKFIRKQMAIGAGIGAASGAAMAGAGYLGRGHIKKAGSAVMDQYGKLKSKFMKDK